ncbi:RagB/SusD family nutrient uptake outer membrane protein [Sphingobacterium haloxyli]|uniref:RagB/SusD family nutrient uptake outer membrane protein n=1 Tax=Sphingobacterium haloxyli TaxID=2100533 RepID=A0A2S9J2H8_9SPHI|nr:RagB/SusD family nutrient uptake outer membrane protein [Sphingobacterium haloxyli]PRD46944.1 RagB/SusD family nutrient uptake outer membrane protein [Sphingobacterium haloxyli]
MITFLKNTIKATVLLTTVWQLSGCQNFLDEINDSAITQENYFRNADQAQSAVDGIYDFLRSSFQNRDGFGEAPWTSMELLVGHATTLGQSTYNTSMISHSASAIDPVFRSVWANLYKGIATANLSIEKIPAVEMDESRKQNLLGQAHFLRAFYYYHLVRLYGNIPLITEAVNATSPQLYPEQAPVKDVYDQIVADLTFAEASGLPNTDQTGRISQGAVKALLSSVYLTMAGYPLNLGESHYQLAADKAKELLDTGWYTLFDDYYALHDRAHKNQQELIFQAQFGSTLATNRIISMITPENIGVSKLSEEQGALMPRNEFVQSYDEGDKRIEEKEFFFTEYLARDGASVKKFGQYALYKYWMEEAAGPNGDANSDINWTFFRLPEVMLIYAEASNEINGPTREAWEQLKVIRDRAEINTPAVETFSKDSFREAVWQERYHELCFENKAYFDIQRTHRVFDLKSGKFVDAFSFQNESGTTFSEQYLLWPIPQNERDTNTKLVQNKNW